MHMYSLVFVFGTLKQGFPNFGTNRGTRVPGSFRTEVPYPLYLVGERHSPWLLDLPGAGHQVVGEVYAVDPEALADMDRLERIHEPDGYVRREIAVHDVQGQVGTNALQVQVYLKRPGLFDAAQARHGPLAEYLPQHAALYRSRVA
eukprot:gene16382-16199_t